jgi:hypothetical protein
VPGSIGGKATASQIHSARCKVTATIIAYMSVTVAGAAAMIGFKLRNLYRREGPAYARWHKRRLLTGLGLSIPLLVAISAVAITLGREATEVFVVGVVGIYETILLWKRFREGSKRGSTVPIGNLPAPQPNRLIPILAVVSASLLVASTLIGGSIGAADAARLVGLAEVVVAGVFLAPPRDQFFEGGVQQHRSFVPWERLQSFRYFEFESTTIFSFQFRNPGWFQREISIGVPRAEVAHVNRWLSTRLPCVGHEDRRSIQAVVS